MTYTISEVANRCGLTAHTLRFYDKQGLLPFVDRNESGIRVFKDSDFPWLDIITCLKDTGMPIKQIKQFVDWCMEGDDTIDQRLEFISNHKKTVEEQIANLQKHMETIDYKMWFYTTAKEAGTTSIHDKKEDAAS